MRSGLQHLLFALCLAFTGCRGSLPGDSTSSNPVRRGTITEPSSPSAVSKTYFHTLDHNLLFLTLREDGTYFAEQEPGMNDGSVSSGQWQLQCHRITLVVPQKAGQTAMWLRNCAELDVLSSERGWVLLPCSDFYRKAYEEYGVVGRACFVEKRKPEG
jgi:hypothetical protein